MDFPEDKEAYTEKLSRFICTLFFRQITGGIHVNDALIYGGWEALPAEWTTWWSSLHDYRTAQQDLIEGIREDRQGYHARTSQSDGNYPDVAGRPSSLSEWLFQIRSLALPRIPHKRLEDKRLPEILVTAFNTKKAAEVAVAAAYIARKCHSRGIIRIVDIGSGQGYLPVALTYMHPELRILAIDGSASQVEGSRKLAASLQIDETRLTHLVQYVDGSPSLADKIKEWAQGQPCLLTGLHACGSLSEHMIRYFVRTECITDIAVIGCCYNHIQQRSETVPEGFPISQRLRNSDVELSATALMTGCQAPENWPLTAGGKKETGEVSKRRFYRALLEKILFDFGIRSKHTETAPWRIRKGDLSSLETFSRRALEALGIKTESFTPDTFRKYEAQYRDHEGKIGILWTLSVLCCKVVESVVAMDRYWYLCEQGALGVEIVPIFEYAVSPRNLMIVASKHIQK